MSIPPDEFARLLQSPLLDTLYSITGKPRKIAQQRVPPRDGDSAFQRAVAMYTPQSDSVSLAPEAFKTEGGLSSVNRPVGEPAPRNPDDRDFTPENTLAHELGHKMFSHAGYAWDPVVQLGEQLSSVNAKGNVPGYGGKNFKEHEAEAFANGVQFMRYTSQAKPGPDARRSLEGLRADYEKAVPGTGYVIDYLLKQPIFARHPLNASAELHNPAPDATAVRVPVVGSLSPRKPPLNP